MPKGIFEIRIKQLLKHLNIKTKGTAIYLTSKDFDTNEDCDVYLDGYMYYLSGIDMPNTEYLYNITTEESTLFYDFKKETETLSYHYSQSELNQKYRVDNILPLKSAKRILARYSKVYRLSDLERHLIKMRLIKTPTEINDIKNVCLLTCRTLKYVIKNIRVGDYESFMNPKFEIA